MPKFEQSSLQINGEIWITDWKTGLEKKIELSPLNRSKSGVYCIRNKFNNRIYIGMAKNLHNRFNRHIRDLLNGKHCSKLMRDDYLDWCKSTIQDVGNPLFSGKIANISPNEIFEFSVIIYCRPSELTFYENILINNLHPEYNNKQIKSKKEKIFTRKDFEEMVFQENRLGLKVDCTYEEYCAENDLISEK